MIKVFGAAFHRMEATTFLFIAMMAATAAATLNDDLVKPKITVCNTSSTDKKLVSDQLYQNILAGHYEDAVKKTLKLDNEGKDDIIFEVVNRLLNETHKNTMEYAYKLWNMLGRSIVVDFFPLDFQSILGQKELMLLTGSRNLDMMLFQILGAESNYSDCYYKRKNSSNWVFQAIWDDDSLYFRIKNTQHKLYHKSNALTAKKQDSSQFIVTPQMHDGDLRFYLVERENTDGSNYTYCDTHLKDTLQNYEIYGWYLMNLDTKDMFYEEE